MIEPKIHCEIKRGVDLMYERCNHFFIVINDLNDFDFVILSSIDNEYTNILDCNSYNNNNYNYFIGLKERDDELIQGLYSMDNYQCVYEEKLNTNYNPKHKHGKHILKDKDIDAIKKAASCYSEYNSGSLFKFNNLYKEVYTIAQHYLNENTFKNDISFWDDGTYEIKIYDTYLLDKYKNIIKNKMVNTENKNKLNYIYKNAIVVCKYDWETQKCELSIYIKNVSDCIKNNNYIIDEFNIYTKFHYIDEISKSNYLFDFSKTY